MLRIGTRCYGVEGVNTNDEYILFKNILGKECNWDEDLMVKVLFWNKPRDPKHLEYKAINDKVREEYERSCIILNSLVECLCTNWKIKAELKRNKNF